MATKNFSGFLLDNTGTAIANATVELFPRNTTTTSTTDTTTNSSGYWAMTTTTENRYDVRITSGSSIRFLKYDTAAQMETLEVANLRLRNPANTYEYDIVPAAITADYNLTLPLVTASDTFAVLGLAQTFSAAQTITNTLTVGVDDTGHDVKFFGATSGSFLLWDESDDALELTDSSPIKIGDGGDMTIYHDGSHSYITNATGALKLATETSGIAITIGHTTSEVTIADNLTVTGTLTLGSGAELVEAELEMLDGITAGTAAASKAVVLDSSKDIATIRNLTIDGVFTDGNYTFDTSGNVSGLGTVASGAITSSGIIKTDNATEATSTTDGSLQTDGGISVVKDAVFGDDIKLLSDSSVLAFGADGDTTLTHTDGTGLTLNSTNKLTFGDTGTFIHQSSDGVLTIESDTTLVITAPTVDLNSSTEFNIDTAAYDLNASAAVTVDASGISLDSDAASNLTTSSGALTLTSAAAATWSTAAGALTLNGTGGVAIQEGGATIIGISDARVLSTSNTASVDLDASGAIQVNSSGGALSIGNDNVDQAINIATSGTRTLTLGIDDGTDLTTVVIKGPVFIGDTANAEMTRGLTVNQGTADNMTFVLKSSDIDHGLSTLPGGSDVEEDDFLTIEKITAAAGGVRLKAMGETGAAVGLEVVAFCGAPSTTDTVYSRGAISWFVVRHDGSNGDVVQATNANAYSWGVTDDDANYLTKMLLKADDGELHIEDTTLVALDTEDDILITRGLQKTSGTGFIDSIYDRNNPFNDYQKLRELKLVGPKNESGMHLFPLQPRLKLHEGALWQLFEDLMSVVAVLPESQRAGLNPRLKSRLLALEA